MTVFLLTENPTTGDLDLSPMKCRVEQGPERPSGDGTRTCRTCRRTLLTESFPTTVVQGVTYHRHVCRPCFRSEKAWDTRAYRDRQWAASYRRRAKAAGHAPVVEPFTRDDVIAKWGDRCFHCRVGKFEQLDHWPTAVADGGHHVIGNVRPSCTDCNRRGGQEVRRRRAEAKKTEASC